jgi:hypothetical protein
LRRPGPNKEGKRTEGNKVCRECKRELPATKEYFNKNNGNKDGLDGMCRECKAEYKKQYCLKNKDAIAEKGKQYREKNKEREFKRKKQYRMNNKGLLDKYSKKYQSENEEYIRDYKKQSYLKNKEKVLERNKQWREKNQERIKKITKEYRDRNPDKVKIMKQRHRALKRQLPATLTMKQWENCLKHFDYKDAYTGLPMEKASQDHLVPLSKLGQYTVDNIIPCEKSINSSKGNRDFGIWYKKQKFYSPEREKAILEYLGYNKHGQQQLTLAL